MKRIVFLIVTFTALSSAAQSGERTVRARRHNLTAVGGFNDGGFTFGLGYEHMLDSSLGLGANLRVFNKDDSATNRANGLLIVGAQMGYHFYKKSWDLAFTPSFNIINIDSATNTMDDASTVGPGFSIGLVCNLTPNLALGFDNSRYWVWFDDDYAGAVMDDFAIKGRFSF